MLLAGNTIQIICIKTLCTNTFEALLLAICRHVAYQQSWLNHPQILDLRIEGVGFSDKYRSTNRNNSSSSPERVGSPLYRQITDLSPLVLHAIVLACLPHERLMWETGCRLCLLLLWGLRLSDKEVHSAVGLRLGTTLCEPHFLDYYS